MTASVPCPKCKGGCDLCGGSGRVTEGAGRVYQREESRRTTRMPGRQLQGFLADEVPTRPNVIAAANRRRRVGRIVLFIVLGLSMGFGIGLLLRALT